jgi:hypothetical protein
MTVTIIDTINNLDVTDETIVTLTYKDRHEGWHSTGDLEENAVRETDTADRVAELITDARLAVRTSFGDANAMQVMRETDFLVDYERGGHAFEQFIAETIRENPHDLDEFVDLEVIQYDHKRGSCTVSASFKTTVGKLKENPDSVSGWQVSLDTTGGVFSFQA